MNNLIPSDEFSGLQDFNNVLWGLSEPPVKPSDVRVPSDCRKVIVVQARKTEARAELTFDDRKEEWVLAQNDQKEIIPLLKVKVSSL